MVSDMFGRGYTPKSVIAGFLSAENQRYLAEQEGIGEFNAEEQEMIKRRYANLIKN
jgi:hypothetical protein